MPTDLSSLTVQHFDISFSNYLFFFVFSYFFGVDHPILILNFTYYSLHCISIVVYTQLRKGQRLTPFRHSKFFNALMLYFLWNSWYANFTKYHPTIQGNLELCPGYSTSFGFQVLRNLTPSTCSPTNSTSISIHLDNGMPPTCTCLIKHVVDISHLTFCWSQLWSKISIKLILPHQADQTARIQQWRHGLTHNFKLDAGTFDNCLFHYLKFGLKQLGWY